MAGAATPRIDSVRGPVIHCRVARTGRGGSMGRLLPESEEYLEDDERQRRILDDRFLREPIAVLQPANPVCAERGTSVGDVVRQMQEHQIGCVLVIGGGKLVGVFTERDLLREVFGSTLD